VIISRGINVLISLGIGELLHVNVNVQPDCTCNEFLTYFIPAFLLEAQKRNHIVESFDHVGYYRHDRFNFYFLPKKREELDEHILEILSGDHPA
jgi:hypothetical protein